MKKNKLKLLLLGLILAVILPLTNILAENNKRATLIYPLTGDKIAVDLIKDVVKIKWLFANDYILFVDNHQLGANIPASAVNWTLASPITISDTTLYLNHVNNLRNDVIAEADMPTKIYLTLEPNNTNSTELVVCPSSGYSTSTKSFTNCTRGLDFSGASEATVTSYRKPHASGSRVTISNPGQFYSNFLDTDGAQTITGVKTFSVSPIVPTPTTATQASNKSYVDGVVVAGGVDSSTTTKGIGKISSAPSVASSPVFLNNEEVATTTGANKVIKANSSGFLDSSWLGSTQSYSLGSTTTVSGTLNVSATTTFSGLTKVATSTPTVAGQVVGLDSSAKLPAIDGYNLTNISRCKNGRLTHDMGTSDTVNTAHGLGVIPKNVRIFATCPTAGACFSNGYYNGTTSAVAWSGWNSSMSQNLGSATTSIVYLSNANGVGNYATIAVDATNIALTWTASGTGTAQVNWEACN